MNKKEKKLVFRLIGVMVIILLIVIAVKAIGGKKDNENKPNNTQKNEGKYVTQLEDGTKVNNSDALQKTKKYKSISISGIQYTSKNGSSVLLADLTNTGSSTFEREEITIEILGENNEIIDTISAVLPRMESGQTKQLNAIATADIVNAKDFKIKGK